MGDRTILYLRMKMQCSKHSNLCGVEYLNINSPDSLRFHWHHDNIVSQSHLNAFDWRVRFSVWGRRGVGNRQTAHHITHLSQTTYRLTCALEAGLCSVSDWYSVRGRSKTKRCLPFVCQWQRIAAVAFVSAVRSLFSRLDYCTCCSTIRGEACALHPRD